MSGMASIRETSFQARYIKMNVSRPVCSAINRYIKITKFSEISKSTQISASVFNLVSYPVYDVGVTKAATSISLEQRHRCQCKSRVHTGTLIGFAILSSSGCEFQAHTFGFVRQLSDLMGRIIESQPTLGLWDMYAAGIVATVMAEQSKAPLWSRNLPPQLS